jgi:hypothetical protein
MSLVRCLPTLPSYFLELQNDNHGLESAKHCKSLFFSAQLTGFLLTTLATSMHLLLLLGERHISVFRSTSVIPCRRRHESVSNMGFKHRLARLDMAEGSITCRGMGSTMSVASELTIILLVFIRFHRTNVNNDSNDPYSEC